MLTIDQGNCEKEDVILRTVEFELAGVKYPLCFTLAAVEKFYHRYGDIDGWADRLREYSNTGEDHPGDTMQLLAEVLWLLDTLMEAGYNHVSQFSGDAETPPGLDELRHMLCVGDIARVRETVIRSITLGNTREVRTQEPKNGEGAPGAG